jgi:uncharacterized protein with PIN domain
VHSPEFDDERKTENLRHEVVSLGIRYPMSQITTTELGTLIKSKHGQGSSCWTNKDEFHGCTKVKDEAGRFIQKLIAEKETWSEDETCAAFAHCRRYGLMESIGA